MTIANPLAEQDQNKFLNDSEFIYGGENEKSPLIPEEKKSLPIRAQPNIGRNEPCPCGSGKKYKKCHGAAK